MKPLRLSVGDPVMPVMLGDAQVRIMPTGLVYVSPVAD
jgi:hypothetical protein